MAFMTHILCTPHRYVMSPYDPKRNNFKKGPLREVFKDHDHLLHQNSLCLPEQASMKCAWEQSCALALQPHKRLHHNLIKRDLDMISSPVSILKVVVFPAPFTPSRPKHSLSKSFKFHSLYDLRFSGTDSLVKI